MSQPQQQHQQDHEVTQPVEPPAATTSERATPSQQQQEQHEALLGEAAAASEQATASPEEARSPPVAGEAPAEAAAYNLEYLDVPGVRFKPSDRDLIVHYLRPMLRGQEPPTANVHICDVYLEHPEKYVKHLKSFEGVWYVFSRRYRKSRSRSRPRRDTGSEGLWKPSSRKVRIQNADEETVIGHRRELAYHDFVYDDSEGPKPAGDKPPLKQMRPRRRRTGWRMVEYVAAGSGKPTGDEADPWLLNDWVLCNITAGKAAVEASDSSQQRQEATASGRQRQREEEEQAAATPGAPDGALPAATQ